MSTFIPSMNSGSKKSSYKHHEGGQYPSRLVRFVGLGIQPQPAFQGQEKSPAFKVATQWQLYNPMNPAEPIMAIEADGTVTDRPSCIFQDFYLFPNAERGKVFDMCKAFDNSLQKAPATLDWYFDKLGQAAMLNVKKYPKKDGTFGNSIDSVQAILPMLVAMMPQATSPLVAFNPYSETQENKVAYAMMFNFQRDMLTQAKDAAHIPLAGTQPIKLDAANASEPTKPEAKEEPNPFDNFDDQEVPF